jgi:hypothetical protein
VSSAWRRALPWIAPTLLAALASLQIVLAHTADLTPWKGGGYGMFSTYDHSGFRTMRAFALDGDGPRRLSIPAALQPDVLRALDLPSSARLERLAGSLARSHTAPRVRVEVWRLEFDGALRPTSHRLTDAESGP